MAQEARVTHVQAEVLAELPANGVVSHLVLEVLYEPPPERLNVSHLVLEVLYEPPPTSARCNTPLWGLFPRKPAGPMGC